MKVKIIKKSTGMSDSWVNEHIGEIFEVRGELEFFIVIKGIYKTRSMYDYCCEIVDDNDNKWIPKNGEVIEILLHSEVWVKTVFIGMDGDCFICKNNGIGTQNYNWWRKARPIQKETIMTISEIEKKLGITNLKVVKEK